MSTMPHEGAGHEPRASDGGAGAPPHPDDQNRAPDLTREYHAPGITVQWFAERCIHSANCGLAARMPFCDNSCRKHHWREPAGDAGGAATGGPESAPPSADGG